MSGEGPEAHPGVQGPLEGIPLGAHQGLEGCQDSLPLQGAEAGQLKNPRIQRVGAGAELPGAQKGLQNGAPGAHQGQATEMEGTLRMKPLTSPLESIWRRTIN